MSRYSPEEEQILLRYFSNTDRPVFAISNLPEIVKGGLFARYSRTAKDLRRLFLDEFYDGSDHAVGSIAGDEKAQALYDRIFIEYGDDSVAQLGGAHLAVEGASNLLTKILERPRLAGYLEQSTRYIAYDDKPNGSYRYHTPAELKGELRQRYRSEMDAIFDAYSAAARAAMEGYERRFPKQPEDTKLVYTQTIRAKALDLVRGMLPAATTSNLGIYAAGQTFESLLLRMNASPLAEARETAKLMLDELRTVVPSFMKRIDQPNRGVAWSDYLRERRERTAEVAADLLADDKAEDRPLVTLTDFDPEGEEKIIAAMLYASSNLADDQLRRIAREMSDDERKRLVRAYTGERANRRHRPGRALEATGYRFDVLSDYGAFRDLQRHRILTIEWQTLTPQHGYEAAPDLDAFGIRGTFDEAMQRSASLHAAIQDQAGAQVAQYAVCMAYRIRYAMQMNARAAMHLIELRSSPQGHAVYRRVAHEMHRAIAEVHPTIAGLMSHVDHSDVDLERLEAERRADRRRRGNP
ncbi:MAG: FAD-dependent thymidylate synthase [Actinomycetota bacterium]